MQRTKTTQDILTGFCTLAVTVQPGQRQAEPHDARAVLSDIGRFGALIRSRTLAR